MAPDGRYALPPGYEPSQRMLDDVGLDFDDDLGGLTKGPPPLRRRLHPAGALVAIVIILLLICINPVYGAGFVSGVILGAVGMLVWPQ